MNTMTVSATAARNNFFNLLDLVKEGAVVVIEKDKKQVATLISRRRKTDWNALAKASAEMHGLVKDFSVDDTPWRRVKADKILGKWDK